MNYPQRKLPRLSGWDYSQNGFYHVTICTKNKRPVFGFVRQDGTEAIVHPTPIGKIVLQNWEKLSTLYPGIHTDYFCLMPNHIHGILVFEQPPEIAKRTLSQVIRSFKSVVTREYNQLVPQEERNQLWQGSYYDEIIRDDDMLYNVRRYIYGNPSKWLDDPMYVEYSASRSER